ncbi:MAG: hypothetical protein J5994_10680 [Ruminococcus sp.]|nr:hypothetical protein [Ruminococcus sp.]
MKLTDETKASIVCAAALGVFLGMVLANHEKLAAAFMIGSLGFLAIAVFWDCHSKNISAKRAGQRSRRLIENQFIREMTRLENDND